MIIANSGLRASLVYTTSYPTRTRGIIVNYCHSSLENICSIMIKGKRILEMVFPRGKIRLSHVCIGLLYRDLTLREMGGRK